MNKTKRFFAFLLTLVVAVSSLLIVPQDVSAAESKKWTVKNIDEQRAVNLTPGDLELWAKQKGYTYSRAFSSNKDTLIITVWHSDDAGERWKKLLAAGRVAVNRYKDDAISAIKQLPEDYANGNVDMNAKSIAKQINAQGVSGVKSIDNMVDMFDAAMSEKTDLQVISKYYYDDMNKSAIIGEVYMSKEGRGLGYEFSQGWNDASGKTSDGYSIKPDKKNKLGYYYKQEPVDWGGIEYWHIVVKPMYNR